MNEPRVKEKKALCDRKCNNYDDMTSSDDSVDLSFGSNSALANANLFADIPNYDKN